MSVGGAIVIIAKCPISGVSKTRCAPLLGYDGAASLAQAMLSDILVSLSECRALRNTLKVLMYAPGTKAGESQMISILQSLKLLHYAEDSYPQNEGNDCVIKNDFETHDTERWYLLPMLSPLETSASTHLSLKRDPNDLNSSALGYKLIDALERTRTLLAHREGDYQQSKAVLFLGMDAPELPIEEIIYGLQISSGILPAYQNDGFYISDQKENRGRAHLCPAADGGFGLLSVPIHAPSSIFIGVRWSSSLTAVSQLKALTDAGVDVSVGKLMFDIDDPSDVHELAARLLQSSQSDAGDSERQDVLKNFTSGIDSTLAETNYISEKCPFTMRILTEFGIIDKIRLH